MKNGIELIYVTLVKGQMGVKIVILKNSPLCFCGINVPCRFVIANET